MHHENMKAWVAPCLILASMWVKWTVGLGSYSGLSNSYNPINGIFIHIIGRPRHATHVWRLRGPEALDGANHTPTHPAMVYL